MNRKTKFWLISACIAILVGLILLMGVMFAMDWNFSKLSTVHYETNEYTLNETVNSIDILTDTSDVTFLPSQDTSVKVICHESAKEKHTVSAANGVLNINNADVTGKKWYEYINFGIDFNVPTLTVYVPQGKYNDLNVEMSTGDVNIPEMLSFDTITINGSTGDVTCSASADGAVNIHLSTGDITLKDLSAAQADLSVSTGTIDISNVIFTGELRMRVSTGKSHIADARCGSLFSIGNTGDISLVNVIAAGPMSIERSTGDVHLELCDAAEITVRTDTGDVTGTLLTEKIFFAETDTGDIDVPKTTNGGSCEIITDTGDISFTIAG